MELESHRTRAEIWGDLLELGRRVFYSWFDDELLDKANEVAGQFGTAPGDMGGEAARWRDRLTAEHLTPEQQRYAGRAYPKGPAQTGRPPPWPAPERVPENEIQTLASVLREEPTSSPKAWGALRVLSVAAAIEAANRAVEASPGLE